MHRNIAIFLFHVKTLEKFTINMGNSNNFAKDMLRFGRRINGSIHQYCAGAKPKDGHSPERISSYRRKFTRAFQGCYP